jgi:DNA polymerase bacteriophage-type
MPVLLDFETRSRVDLTVVGGRQYFEHPSTEALCCVLWDTDRGELEVWERGQPRPKLLRRGGQLGAHNARGFDRFASKRLGWGDIEIDTSELARAAGLPGALDALATRWLGLEKDKVASKFTKGLSSARRPTAKTATRAPGGLAIEADDWNALDAADKRLRGVLPVCGPAEMARVKAYCLSDVEILAHGWDTLETWQGIEPEVQRVERAINDRGVCFDVQLARRLLACDQHNAEQIIAGVARRLALTPGRVREMAGSPEQFADFTGLPNAQAATIAEALASGELSPAAEALCQARGALASITSGKLQAGLACVSADGRLRDMHRYLSAHTWRWSGTKIQLQNVPRPAARFEDWHDAEICELITRTLAGYWPDQDEIDLMLRACIFAKPGHTLVVEDFSGVEARGLAWAAGDYRAIKTLLSKDVYKVNASAIFGVLYEAVTKPQRQAGKVAELACGYQGGEGAIKRFAKQMGVNLAASGAEPKKIVDAWRALHPAVVKFWHACERAMKEAIQGNDTTVGPFRFVHARGDVAVFMPNDRPLVYNSPAIRTGERGRPVITYHGTKNPEKPFPVVNRRGQTEWHDMLYGGKIVENLIQSCCRELLAGALVEADDAGLDPVLHVHDEIVAEVPRSAEAEAREYLHDIMTTVPDWAEGFPLGADGHAGTRYRK